MAAAIRKISIARGHDVTRYALACFGGAGGQHACRVADALGMERILIHPLAGVLSAYGIGLADVKAFRERSWLRPLGEPWAEPLAELEEAARGDLVAQGFAREQIVLHRRARLRAPGSDTTIEVDLAAPEAMRAAFDALHRRRFGFVDPAEPVVDTLSVEAVAGAVRADRGRRCSRSRREPDRGGRVDGLSPRRTWRGAGDRRAGAGPRSLIGNGGRARLAGGARRRRDAGADAHRPARARARHRHRGRPGAAGDLQQPLHGDRRGNGGRAAIDRGVGQHQGAARFLLRLVRRGRAR